MAIKIDCYICDNELNNPGWLWITPPVQNSVEKIHICKVCGDSVHGYIIGKYLELNP